MGQDIVRDKDAVSACSLLAEICAYAKDKGKTLYDLLMDIYLEYGFSEEHTVNVERPGKSGADEIQQMMRNFRTTPPTNLGGSTVCLWKDYEALEATDATGTKTKNNNARKQQRATMVLHRRHKGERSPIGNRT